MTKIYTPKEWESCFPCPSIVIDDNGYIFSEEEYRNLLKTPIGRIDYDRMNVYGKDYSSWTATPIAYLIEEDGVTKVFEYGKTQFSDPILYIADNKIYTPEAYTRWFKGDPIGHIEEDEPINRDVGKDDRGGGNNGHGNNSNRGGGGDGGGGCSIPFWAILIGAFFLYLIVKSIKYMVFDMTGLGVSVGACILFSILIAKIGPIAHLEKNQTAIAQCKEKAKSSATVVAVVCGIAWLFTAFKWFTKAGGRMDMMLLILAMAVGFTLAAFFTAKLYFYRRYLTQSGGNATAVSAPPKKQSFGATPTTQTPPKTTKPPVTETPQNVDPFNGVFDNKTIVRCPRCRAKCRVSSAKGPSTVVCPKCKNPFQINT